jgi:hypothetical protein
MGILKIEYASCNQLLTQYDLDLPIGFDRLFAWNRRCDIVAIFIPPEQTLGLGRHRRKYLS